MTDKPKETEIKRNENGTFAVGTAGGPGRPFGLRDFRTDFDAAVEEYAKEHDMTKSDARIKLMKVGMAAAMSGEFKFYKYVIDQDYGKARESMDITSGGEKIQNVSIPQEAIEIIERDLKKKKTDESE